MSIRVTLAALFILGFGFDIPAGEMIPLSEPLRERGYRRIAIDQGVTVYQDEQATLITLAAEGTFAAPPIKVRKVLLDYDSHTRMVKQVTKSHILERGPTSLLVYQVLSLPIVSNRDQVLRVEWGEQGEILWVQFNAVTDREPQHHDDAVRITQHSGSWQLKPLDGGRFTQARYQVAIDLAGLLPRWMAGWGSANEIPELFAAIRKRLAETP